MTDTITAGDGNAKPNKRGQVPVADLDFGDVSQKVSTQWTATPAIKLLWATAADFAAKSETYRTILASRNQTGSTRPQITRQIELLDKKIDENLSFVKNYIAEKHKKDAAKSYYPAFGMEFRDNSYRIPRDQNSRSESLQLMLDGLSANGFNDKEYGKTFWLGIKTEYDALRQSAGTSDGQISAKVGGKNVLKNDLKKMMNSLIWVIKGNYPDTYPQELRSWGFQKEKY